MLRETSWIDLGGKAYPYKMDNIVLAKIQESYGTIQNFELALMGWKEEEKDGKKVVVKEKEPSVVIANWILPLMIREGYEILGQDIDFTDVDIIRSVDMSIYALADEIHDELKRALFVKKREPNQMIQRQIQTMTLMNKSRLTLIGCLSSAVRLFILMKKR